jgi:cysteinyl-tRNA synthetase
VSEEIPGIIDMIQGLIDKGYAIGARRCPLPRHQETGKLSHQSIEKPAEERDDPLDGKENPLTSP